MTTQRTESCARSIQKHAVKRAVGKKRGELGRIGTDGILDMNAVLLCALSKKLHLESHIIQRCEIQDLGAEKSIGIALQ